MKRFRYSLLAAIFIFGLVLMPFPAYAQQQTDQPPAEPTPAHEMHGEHTQEETETDEQSAAKMMPYHQRMMERMREMDARLDEKVKAMNEATGEQKVTAMAAVLNELIEQRKTMHHHMMAMHGRMCRMMDRDRPYGGMHGMSGCPKMKMKHGKMELPEGLEGKNVVVIIQK